MLKTHLCALVAACLSVFSVAAHADTTELVTRGQYLATAGDCIACHSAPGGKPFAGGLEITTPLGKIVSTNITPSTTHGIGSYTLAQFGAALRHGVRADGAHLYPAMPYTAYAKVNDADVAALYAYFHEGVQAVDAAPPPTALPFPFNIRLSMAAWNLLFLDDKPFAPDAKQSAEWNRGAYLALGLAHCSTCHTPRNLLMAEDLSKSLGGDVLASWYAPNISSDALSGIGGWSQAELVAYLRTGHAEGKAQAAGPMAEAIDNSFRHLSEADVNAMAVYLKSTAPVHNPADTQAAYRWGQPTAGFVEVRGVDLPADANQWAGAQLYDAHCASCHQASGEGVGLAFNGARLPSLFHNTALGHANANNLVSAILEGVQRQSGGPNVLMPAFAKDLSDTQIATLGNYLLQHFGNPAAHVTAEQVSTLRSGGEASALVLLARIGMGVGLVLLLLLLLLTWLLRRKTR
ncbi:cytochrome c [Rhodoferax sp.]|uniref:c-type cytochrome n=1 Tax=Rhodoferax sp. TaxID=50421 RepID=UPI0025F3855B|nr:cytochrome c [Rhodoferax sp.]